MGQSNFTADNQPWTFLLIPPFCVSAHKMYNYSLSSENT